MFFSISKLFNHFVMRQFFVGKKINQFFIQFVFFFFEDLKKKLSGKHYDFLCVLLAAVKLIIAKKKTFMMGHYYIWTNVR
jgi:hypothetical protein